MTTANWIAFIVNVSLLVAVILVIRSTRGFSPRFMGIGILDYILCHVGYSAIMSFLKATSLFCGNGTRILCLGILFVLSKMILYMKWRPQTTAECLSIACGDGLTTLFCLIFPTVLNNLSFSIHLAQGTIYSSLQEQGYSLQQVQQAVSLFQQNTTSYYFFTAVAGMLPFVLHGIVAELVAKQNNHKYFAFLISLFGVYVFYGLPLISYLAAAVVILAVSLFGMWLLQKNNKGENDENSKK